MTTKHDTSDISVEWFEEAALHECFEMGEHPYTIMQYNNEHVKKYQWLAQQMLERFQRKPFVED